MTPIPIYPHGGTFRTGLPFVYEGEPVFVGGTADGAVATSPVE